MNYSRGFRVWILAGALVIPAFAQPHPKPAAPGAPKVVPARPQKAPPPTGGGQAENRQPDQVFEKLLRLGPEDRARALSQLPPAQRERIEERLQTFEKLPPAAQTFRREELDLLHRLPQQRQNQVRKSVKDLELLPEDRRAAVNFEMRRMALMPDDERRAHMNSEEFRNRYSPAEQQMMSNLTAILPLSRE
jgi:hypothetical protein